MLSLSLFLFTGNITYIHSLLRSFPCPLNYTNHNYTFRYIRDLSDRVAAIEGRRPDQGSPSPLPAALPVGRKRSSEAADLPAAGPGERRPPAPPLGVFNPQNPTIIKIQDPAMARTPVAKSDAEPFSADEVAVLEQ